MIDIVQGIRERESNFDGPISRSGISVEPGSGVRVLESLRMVIHPVSVLE
jgi:hypothetical protein